MKGYCNQCEKRCALDDLHCGRGYSALERDEELREEDDFHTLPLRPEDGLEDPFETLPLRPEDETVNPFETLPLRPGEAGPGSGRRFDRRGAGPREGMPPHGMPPHGMPPRGGGKPFGRPPRPAPDGEMLRSRIAEADLRELIELAGRLMRHRPGAGSWRGQNLVLSILAGRESLSQRELQQMLGVQPGSMSELITKLERKGLLTRERGEDRRGNLLRITDAGRAAIPNGASEPEDALFSALDADQHEQLAALLRLMLNDWASRLQEAERRPGPEEGFTRV